MSNTALITGASSGLGRAFAKIHAAKGGDVIITARREAELNALRDELVSEFGVTVKVIPLDLGAQGAAADLYRLAKDTGLGIDVLINNAGFGGHGLFGERPLADELAMIDLDVKALVALTHFVANDMKTAGQGRILNVGSSAGFMPGPLQAIYFASKAFVNSFSQAIDQELRPFGVTSTLLAPGAVATGFFEAADLSGTNLGKSPARADDVARIGYDAMLPGKLQVINEAKLSFVLNWLQPLLPRRGMLKMVEKMQTKPAA